MRLRLQPRRSTLVAAGNVRSRRRLPAVLLGIGIGAGVVVGGLVALRAAWPAAQISATDPALARVELAPFGEHVTAASVVIPSGHWIPAHVDHGLVDPTLELATDSRVTVELTVRRAGWIGWLVGSTEHAAATIETPAAPTAQRILSPAAGSRVDVGFSVPVSTVSLRIGHGPRQVIRLSPARRTVPLDVVASGIDSAGMVLVSASARSWERPPPATSVSWFAPAPVPELLASPGRSATIDPSTPLVLTFSDPVASVLGTRRPKLWPPTPGRWVEPNPHTLVFRPTGLGFEIGARVRVGLTRPFRVAGSTLGSMRTLSWQVAPGSTARLEQLLAQLDYLPLSWQPATQTGPESPAVEAHDAIDPPRGMLAWRATPPAALRALWASASERAVVVRGAVMAFQSVRGLVPTGIATPGLWRQLLDAVLAHRVSPYGYSYVYVTETLPETLTLWHDGHIVLTTPINTGIPGRPTALGTYPVYLHLASTTMSGTNPNGTPYSDPDVPWVNYFNGGDAVHGFPRASYGFPQSLGCVEAPITTAAEIWPYVQVGTLVTIVA